MTKKQKSNYVGSSLDELLSKTGQLTEVNRVAIKRVITWQLAQERQGKQSANPTR